MTGEMYDAARARGQDHRIGAGRAKSMAWQHVKRVGAGEGALARRVHALGARIAAHGGPVQVLCEATGGL